MAEKRAFPGAVAAVGDSRGVFALRAVGRRSWEPREEEMAEDTLFDLASLAKPIATSTAVMQLVEAGELRLDDPAARFLPDFARAGKGGVTIRQLLSHTSGLPAWEPLYERASNREEMKRALMDMELEYPPGTKVVYSCLGFIALGYLLEEVSQMGLDEYTERYIFRPLGMGETMFNPPKSLRDRAAPTELCALRGRILRGEVHDENAFRNGGASGNAGLFSTAGDLVRFCQFYLRRLKGIGGKVLSPETARLAVRCQTEGLNDRGGLGWLLHSETASSAGDRLSRNSFGHTGFTGTSLWIDPENDLFSILLTNRIHTSRNMGQEISRARPIFNDLAFLGVSEIRRRGDGA
ncbi:MAG: serine hydrolase domain-containing protein [bacterium]